MMRFACRNAAVCARLWAALLVCVGVAHAAHQPREVLVVYNADSPTSTVIARYYLAKRHVTQSVAIHCPDSAVSTANETLPYTDYIRAIAAPVGQYLATHPGINFIVLTKGVPIRIDGALTGDGAPGPLQPSLDSYLAAIDYPTRPGSVKASLAGSGTVGTGWINHYYNTHVPFSHAAFGGYLVTRLDGYTQADALGLVDQALAAERRHGTGQVLLDIAQDFGAGDSLSRPLTTPATVVTAEAAWSTWNADMWHASALLDANAVSHDTEAATTFIGQKTGLLGYYSWGSNDDHFDPQAYASLRFAPGSIGDTAVSTSARTFLPTTGGQSLMADLIAHGLTCCQGYAGEPILDGISSPTIDLSHYLAGYTMAESFYAGTPYLGWEGICVGDPLCCPYAGHTFAPVCFAAAFQSAQGGLKPEPCREGGQDLGTISDGNGTTYPEINLTGATRFVVRVASPGVGGVIEAHLDRPEGTLIARCPVSSTGDWQRWQTQSVPVTHRVRGTHTLCLVYHGASGNLFNLEWFALTGPDDARR